MKKYLRKFRDFLDKHSFLPKFTSDAVFLMVVALGAICFFDAETRKDALGSLILMNKAAPVVILGIVFTVYTTFFVRFKTQTQKHYMLWFALVINFIAAVLVLLEMAAQQVLFVWYVLPLLNMAIFVVVVVFWYSGLYGLGRLETKASSYASIFYGTASLMLALLFYRNVIGASWEYFFSGAVVYASLFNRKLVEHFPKFSFGREGKIDVTQNLIDESTEYSLSLINSVGFRTNQLFVVTDSKKEIVDVPREELSELDEYVSKLIESKYQNDNVAVVFLGSYQWKKVWWGKKRESFCLIIDVFLSQEKKRHEFFQAIKEDENGFRVSNKGLAFQKSYKR